MAERVTVHVPTVLRAHVEGEARVELAGATVREILGGLMDRHPRLRGRLLDERNDLNRFINVYLNDEDIRFLENLDTPVKDGDALMIVPAIAGGTGGPGSSRPSPPPRRRRSPRQPA
jgi:molybdopterin synthase sulfur carrier subunit